jgi:hypothetical protein
MTKNNGHPRHSSVHTILVLRGVLAKLTLEVIKGQFNSIVPKEAADEFTNSSSLRAFLKRVLIGDDHVGDAMRLTHVEAVWESTKPLRKPTPTQTSHLEKLCNFYGPFSILAALQLLMVVKDGGEETTWLASLTVLGDSEVWELSDSEDIENWWTKCRRADKQALGSNNRMIMQLIHDAESYARKKFKAITPDGTFSWFEWVAYRHNAELVALEWIKKPSTNDDLQVSKIRFFLLILDSI